MARERTVGRYYPVARTAHLERLKEFERGSFLYGRHRSDWDADLAARSAGVERVRLVQVLWRIVRGDYTTLEVPEPLALPLLPHSVLLALAARFRRAMGLPPVHLVSYAIENLDQTGKLADRTMLPESVAGGLIRVCLRLVLGSTSRLAFGTSGAQETYRKQLGGIADGRRRQFEEVVFEALPSARPAVTTRLANRVCFLGSFEHRKGIHRVIDSWPRVVAADNHAQLLVIGHGELEGDVQRFAKANPSSVTVLISPPRDVIAQELDRTHCLVLPSSRTATWREQVGLPIVEALSSGCEIVSTDETGLAPWLRENGHQVLPAQCSDEELADSIVTALRNRRSAEDVKKSLPPTDARLEADRWLFGTNLTSGTSEGNS